MNNKERALKTIKENSGRFTAAQLADFLGIKRASSMRLIELGSEENIIEYRKVEIEKKDIFGRKVTESEYKWFYKDAY